MSRPPIARRWSDVRLKRFRDAGLGSAFEAVDQHRGHQGHKERSANHLVSPVSFVSDQPVPKLLERAFAASGPAGSACASAAKPPPSAPTCAVAAARARERVTRASRDGGGARAALDRAAALAPDWEAVAYESGKLYLVNDDMTSARDAFQRAADLMPTFSAAFSNLGATLGELGEPAAALQAFRQALAHDPRSVTLLNNIGVVCRELRTARRIGGSASAA